MSSKDKRVTLDLTGSRIQIDGEERIVTDGELVAQLDYLYAVDDDPDDPTETVVSTTIDIETGGLTDTTE